MYRLEQEFNRQGLKLSRQTMANWLLKASEKWLQPVYDVLHEQLCREAVLHADGYQGDTTDCRGTSVWWAAGRMQGENLTRH